MSAVSSLVPARFLTIIAHLVIVITIFWSRENNVKACLPLDFTQEQYDTEDRRLVVALSVTLGLFAIELAGFFSGVSMFNCSQGLLSTGVHASASVALLFFLFEQWECHIYWWILAICSASVSLSFFVFEKWECWTYWVIFATCSVLPALVEILLFIAVFGLKKKPL
uniref:Transmembrane protein 107 n=1 Tax=Oreochromis aureus TaxID=47969 RepID=A0A668TMD7_OREAU